MTDDEKAPQNRARSSDRRGLDGIEPGRTGGASRDRKPAPDAGADDAPGAETKAGDRPPRM
ncbi:hypothetical protein Q8W71_13200 [Methylobacterium sp. NEAU 140]|uniref:hypothetical protein n=1 Tax=Methylobacterium sp. NEAU 140 TaxID=3064945 RepID=UPI0027346453|nr:hypothetical protein [Methylobacterium sp. NEAU 140]MDP4023589.1 hypothetical protein [Methylobacterium sp. NEAU 140]